MDVRVRLLGIPDVHVAGERLDFTAGKRATFLAYLAYHQGVWVSRSDLALLFWSDVPEPSARANLRQTLWVLRKTGLGDALEADDVGVRFAGDVDLTAFAAAREEGAYQRGLELWRGPFLEGWSVSRYPRVDAWVARARSDLSEARRDVLVGRAAQLERVHDFLGAADLLGEAWEEDVLMESALLLQIWLLQRAGAVARATAAARSFRKAFLEQIGFSPDGALAEALALAEAGERIAEPQRPAVASIASRRAPVPTPATPFVGRGAERRDIEELLGRPAVSLVTIVAPGGMGKTRLALEIASSLRHAYRDGVTFVSFVAVSEPEQIEATLADALDISLAGEASSGDQLVDALAHRRMLLVLDNLEQLSGRISVVSEILVGCPGVDVLATSRERLNLSREWVFDLAGLDFPEVGSEDVSSYESLDLFVQAGRRVRRGFAPDPSELEHIARLCRLVGGMPLALDLAAAWLRVLSVDEVVALVEQGLEMLESAETDLPDRHRSVRAVCDSTWIRMSEQEQLGWARLSMFEGGFTAGAAGAVANVSIRTLLSLADKSVISRSDVERFSFHPLLRQFGRERLASLGLDARTRMQHAQYFLARAQELGERIKHTGQRDVLRAFGRDLSDIRAAWRSAVEFRAFGPLAAAAPHVAHFFDLQRYNSELATLCDAAVEVLEAGAPDVDRKTALARVLPWTSGAYRDGIGVFRRSLALAESVDDTATRAEMHKWLSWIVPTSEARDHFEASTGLYEELGDAYGRADALLRFAMRLSRHGRHDEAQRHFDEALELSQRFGNLQLEGEILGEITDAFVASGDFGRAASTALRAQDIYSTLGIGTLHARTHLTLSRIARLRGNREEALEHLSAFSACSGTKPSPRMREAKESMLRAELCYSDGDYLGARAHALEALNRMTDGSHDRADVQVRLARSEIRLGALSAVGSRLAEAYVSTRSRAVDHPAGILDLGVAVAELLVRQGHLSAAAELVHSTRCHQALRAESRREVALLLRGNPCLHRDGPRQGLTRITAMLEDVLPISPDSAP